MLDLVQDDFAKLLVCAIELLNVEFGNAELQLADGWNEDKVF